MKWLETGIVVACAAPVLWLLWRRTREMRASRTMDGVHMGSHGALFEIVDPVWWRVDRWLLWMRAEARVDVCLPDGFGKPRLLQLRARAISKPPRSCPLCKRPYK